MTWGHLRRSLILVPMAFLMLSGCGNARDTQETAASAKVPETSQETQVRPREYIGSMELDYADQFAVDYYSDGTSLITLAVTGDKFLVVPEGVAVPEDAVGGAAVIQQPVESIYQASSSAVDLFLQLDALDSIKMTSTSQNNWAIPEVVEAMDSGKMAYAGKYSAPDYEMIVLNGCDLVIENTMIYHSPDIKEKLEALGLPVLVERSSYEKEPLGRVEWIKLYGLILGKENEAEDFFEAQTALVRGLEDLPETDVKVAFFHISTTGAAVVRKPGDYVTKMIETAGGSYAFSHIDGQDDNALSTMNMQMEAFYAGARDADILIYNSTIVGGMDTIGELLNQSSLLADFKAVQEGNVWCTEQNMFQKSSAIAGMIADFNAVITGKADKGYELTFMHKLK